MNIQGSQLKPNTGPGSGRVRRYVLPGGKLRVTQITTFCPDIIGPGPAHLYLIEGQALILIDAGIPTDLAKAMFYYTRAQLIPREIEALPPDYSEQERQAGLELAGCALEDLDLLVITHGHPDHFFMGRSVVSRSKAGVMAHILDTPMISNPWGFLSMIVSRRPRVRATGMPPPPGEDPKNLGQGFNPHALGLALDVNHPVFEEGPLSLNGSAVKGVQIKHLPGHSPGSLGLVVGAPGKPKVLICGDVLLYPITPHPDDLLVYLRTLNELSRLDDIALVLPAHGMAFRDLKKRIAQLKAHHRRRLKMTYDACRKPKCIWDIATMKGYFDVYVDPEKFNPMAGNEALVHMELMQLAGGLERIEIKDGVHYYLSSPEPFHRIYGRIMDIVNDPSVEPIMRY